MAVKHHALWAPDIIKESNGIACGDMLSISAYREDGRLFFSYSGNACSVALKVSAYLENLFSGEEESVIKEGVERLRQQRYNSSEQWIAELLCNRRDCVESPISLLYGVIGTAASYDINNRDKTVLACDACVSTKPFNWKPESDKKQKSNLKEILGEIKNIDDSKEIEFQKLGSCVLTEEQQALFRKRFENITDSDFKLIKKLRLASPLFNNAYKYDLKIDPRIKELAVKQAVSSAIANEEIKIIDGYIIDNNLKIDAVKGGRTNRYYPLRHIRAHMDFDYLAADFDDAFKLISYLINCRNFKMVVGGSVPFSLKSVINWDGEEVLTGHIHLEKILQDKYQVIVDINMGGFPLGRTGIIQCNRDGKIEPEDLICITVSHLFKHEYAFMKDINDLYYILESKEIDNRKLLYKINKYGLSNLFSITYDFLKEYMGLNRNVSAEPGIAISSKRKNAWPFSRKAHFYIKAIDMLTFNKMQYGDEKGTTETINQICGMHSVTASNKYKNLCNNMNERVYLYPVTFFKEHLLDCNDAQLVLIDKHIMRYKQLLVLPIGLFLIQNGEGSEMSREILNDEVDCILRRLNLSEEDCNKSYVMEARKDTWLY